MFYLFFYATRCTQIYTLSLHDALPIYVGGRLGYRSSTPNASVTTRPRTTARSEEHTSELQSQSNLVCRLLLEKKKPHRVHYQPPVRALEADLLPAPPHRR